MEPVTYTLRVGENNSETYYRTVRDFTDEVLKKSKSTIRPLASDFIEYINEYNLEHVRNVEEYLLELISFGVLWRTYAATALSVKYAPFILMSKMGEWRKKHQKLKPYIDNARGILMTLFLLPENITYNLAGHTSLEQIDNVCKWFEATGEFKEQALRFIRWRGFWGSRKPEYLIKVFSEINGFTEWFDTRSNEVLGSFTRNIKPFLELSRKRYRWREDRISCTRTRLEYHLNMVGAEIMNRAFKEDFNSGDSKVVLLPGCMRAKPENECEAVRVKEGLFCSGCTKECRVNQLRLMGKKQEKGNQFEVFIIPHASDLSLWSPKNGEPVRSVIASACVTTLVEGGWELKRYDVPAQCVLLDYSGCRKHWHCEGVPTALNIRELKRIIGQENYN